MDKNESPQPPPDGDQRFAPPAAPLLTAAEAEGRKRGSLWAGFGLFWAIFVGVPTVVFPGLSLLRVGADEVWLVLGVGVPLCAPLALCIWLAARGRTRAALGIVLGYGSVAGLALLLFSVCVGVMG